MTRNVEANGFGRGQELKVRIKFLGKQERQGRQEKTQQSPEFLFGIVMNDLREDRPIKEQGGKDFPCHPVLL